MRQDCIFKSVGVSSRFFNKSWVFFMLQSVVMVPRLTLSINSLDSLYACAFHQFTMWRVGWSGLCIFIKPLMEGAEGFILMYFHLYSVGIRVGLRLTLGTVRPLYRTGFSLLQRTPFIYLINNYIFHYLIFAWPCIIDSYSLWYNAPTMSPATPWVHYTISCNT